ncbi:MAG: hypothetical protein IAE81_21790 [Caldilineaceae bacterium]|jgi:hypothetical protein|nr:hypothetical protein [Caldilineaceae bacterium]
MSTLYDPDLTQWLQLSGEYIGRVRPANERVDWIMFLFEQIKPFISQEEYQKLLAEVRAALETQQQ